LYDTRISIKRGCLENRILFGIMLVGLILRLFVLFTEGNLMFLGTDDDNYRETAEILIKQGELTYAGWKEPTVFIMPGYPVFLAAIFLAVGSTSWFTVRLVQVIISLVLVWFTYKLGEKLSGRQAGIIAAFICAIYPPNLTVPCFLLTEVIFTCLLLAALLAFIKAERTDSHTGFALTGFILALATYFRPTAGLLPVVFGFYLFTRRLGIKKVFQAVFIMGATILLCLSPWIIRNYMIYKEFIPFTVSGGNPFLRGTYIDEKINEKFPWIEGQRILSDKAQMEYGKKRLINGFRTNFKAYLHWYAIDKLKDFWVNPYYYKELSYLPEAVVTYFHRLLLIAGGAGLILGLLQRKPIIWLFFLVSAYFTFVHIVYLTGPRYSYPVMPLVIVSAGYFLGKLFFHHRE
jgi:4-amino-4-deoxy-L-arabinose transferase-like glycosyltransferase